MDALYFIAGALIILAGLASALDALGLVRFPTSTRGFTPAHSPASWAWGSSLSPLRWSVSTSPSPRAPLSVSASC